MDYEPLTSQIVAQIEQCGLDAQLLNDLGQNNLLLAMKGHFFLAYRTEFITASCMLHSQYCTLSMQNRTMHLECMAQNLRLYMCVCVLRNVYLCYVSD